MNKDKLDAAIYKHLLCDMTRRVMQNVHEHPRIANLFDAAFITSDLKGVTITDFEWWMVTCFFANGAHDAGELVIKTPDGNVWGRRNREIVINQDTRIQNILKAMDEI